MAGTIRLAGTSLRLWFADWSRFERLWLLVFTAVNVYVYLALDDTLLGLVTSLTGMMTVVLVAKGKLSNYYFGAVNVVLYAYLSWRNGYFGEVMLNLGFFFPMQFVGYWLWSGHRAAERGVDDVEVRVMSWQERGLWLALSLAATYGYGVVLERLGGTLPYWDSTSTVLSVIAMLLMVRRVTEQWVLWIAVNLVSIYMWAFALAQGGSDVSMVVMWSAYLANAVYGLWNWTRMATSSKVAGTN